MMGSSRGMLSEVGNGRRMHQVQDRLQVGARRAGEVYNQSYDVMSRNVQEHPAIYVLGFLSLLGVIIAGSYIFGRK